MAQDPLTSYKAKRNFSRTSEPKDGGEASARGLRYVIQKHWASHLHYDFRLELDGAMKSWAVPKGPSFDCKDKRLAVHVEDHPISYSDFEGTIPAKQYGAGKVLIWDSGTWHPIGDAHKGYRDGDLKFELRGHKLRGRWVLVRMKSKGEKQSPWLLIKEKDQFTRPQAEFSVVDEFPDSVKERPALESGSSPRRGTEAVQSVGKKLSTAARTGNVMPPGAIKADLPSTLSPQLASLVDGPMPDLNDWVYEIKFDGYRLLTRIDGADIKLFTRNGNDWTSKLLPLQKNIAKLKLPPGWYDGEIVVPNAKGVPDFGALQQSFDVSKTNDIILYLFDLPYFDGHDMRAVTLEARREVLQRVLDGLVSEQVRFSAAFDAPPASVIASACKLGLEGVIAKRRDAPYVSRRSSSWRKLKCSQRQEFVIGGYTDPQGTRRGLGALLLGVYDDQGRLQYAGKVGTGFSERTLATLKIRLDTLASRSNPFLNATTIAGEAHWLRPLLVAEVSFGEWTGGGHIRHAVFHGLRSDKMATAVVREESTKVVKTDRHSAATKSLALSARLHITHPDRIIDASTGITKIELVRYYGLVGELMMEHLAGRPVSLLRMPSGVGGALFFQKHAEIEKLPGFKQLDPALDRNHPPLLEVADKLGLQSAAQWNVVEFHTVNATSKSFARPDRMVFDLDPGEGVRWTLVQEAAELLRAFLTQLGLPAYLKTSGGKGLHVVVPLRKVHDWDTVKGFSQAIVLHLATTIPQRFVAKSGPRNRIGKIFIDYLRNTSGATTVSAWSARARPGLGISVPVDWRELNSLTSAAQWSVRNVHTRLDKGNAPWSGYHQAAQSLTAAMKLMKYKRKPREIDFALTHHPYLPTSNK